MEGAVAHHEESGGHAVAPVRRDGPAQADGVPRNGGDLSGEAGPFVQVELPGDPPAVSEDLRRPGVLLAGDVRGLLEERKVHVGLDVALCTRVPVPVPGATEVAALLNDAKVVDTRLGEPCAGDQAGETAADDRDGDVVEKAGAIDRLRVGVVEVVREWSGYLDVLGVRILSDPLVALRPILLAQCVRVEVRCRRRRAGVAHHRGALRPRRICIGPSSASAKQRSPAGCGDLFPRYPRSPPPYPCS